MPPPKLPLCVGCYARTLIPGTPPHNDGTPELQSPLGRGRVCRELCLCLWICSWSSCQYGPHSVDLDAPEDPGSGHGCILLVWVLGGPLRGPPLAPPRTVFPAAPALACSLCIPATGPTRALPEARLHPNAQFWLPGLALPRPAPGPRASTALRCLCLPLVRQRHRLPSASAPRRPSCRCLLSWPLCCVTASPRLLQAPAPVLCAGDPGLPLQAWPSEEGGAISSHLRYVSQLNVCVAQERVATPLT